VNVSGDIAVRVLTAIPSSVAALYYALSPFFGRLVCTGLADYLGKVDHEWQGSLAGVPPHRSTEAISAIIDWVVDAPQMVPALLLPLTTAVFALRNKSAAAIVLSFSVVGICAATLWIYSCTPLEYRSKRLIGRRYTVVALAGVILNIASATVVVLS
jgi:hypothetical protein